MIEKQNIFKHLKNSLKLQMEKIKIKKGLLKHEILKNQNERKHLLKFKEGAWLIQVFLKQKLTILLKMTG